jgi:hypothetical protein
MVTTAPTTSSLLMWYPDRIGPSVGYPRNPMTRSARLTSQKQKTKIRR